MSGTDPIERIAAGDPAALLALATNLVIAGKYSDALPVINRILQENPDNGEACALFGEVQRRFATHRGVATARDMLLRLIAKGPVPFSALRQAAACCSTVGPVERAVELWRAAALRSGAAEDYYNLSEILAVSDRLAESADALRMAVGLDPDRYKKSLEDLVVAESVRDNLGASLVKKGRYPDTDLIQNDLRRTIMDFVAADLKDSAKFIRDDTTFFTMGSCFANNLVRALVKGGYNANCMTISEYINSTFANRYFVDWLEDALPEGELARRIHEVLPEGFSKDHLLGNMKQCDVFILTLGVAPCFFDRDTGDFVMPRPTALNSRALAEKYRFRTTTVAENVENLVYLLSYIRKINPDVKIVITESPVPIQMTFEYKSAVVADCLSKSTLRVAAHELVNNSGFHNIVYWPSFEVFRWMGGHLGPVYGTDDGAAWHVSEAIVDLVVSCFIDMFKIA